MTETSLYERIGGRERVGAMAEAFYNRVLADPDLAPYFEKVPMDRLLRMQTEFFSAALDGPLEYTGRPLSEAHAGLGITVRHFARFVEHLLACLEELDLSDREVRDVIERISTYRNEILGVAGSSG